VNILCAFLINDNEHKMRRFRMLDILKRIGAGIILFLFVVSSYEDSFAFSFEHYFSESSHQSTVSDTVASSNDVDRTDSYDACGKQHSGRLPCENDCQLSDCRDAIVPSKGSTWKKYGAKLPFSGMVSAFRPSVPELTRSPSFRYPFSEVPDKNSYASLIGIIKNQN